MNLRKRFKSFQDEVVEMYPELFTDKDREPMVHQVTFQVTDACNLACKYCYQINKGARTMKLETAKKLIDMMLHDDPRLNGYVDRYNSPGIVIEFIGGEPLLEAKLIEDIIDYFFEAAIAMQHPWAKICRFSICSNGTLYFEEDVQHLLTKYQEKISFSVTIDGNKELHDSCRIFHDGTPSYDMAVAAAKDWMNRGYYMGSKITIAPGNLEFMNEAIIHMVELGYEEIMANTVFEEGWTAEHGKIFYQKLKEIADYWNDNNLVDTHYLSLFDEDFFEPMDPEDNQNWCFKAGTMILTPNGNKLIEELHVGDNVVTKDGNVEKITVILTRKATDTCCLKASGILDTFTTEDHPYFAKKISSTEGGETLYSEPGFVKAKDLVSGDLIALYCTNFGEDESYRDLAYVVGRYIGDGWHSTTGYKICCGYDELEELASKLNECGVKYSIDPYPTVYQFNISKQNERLISMLEKCGESAERKKIPGEVFSWDKVSVKRLLDGLFDADGYYYEKKQCQKFNTISHTLFTDLCILIHSLGYGESVYKDERRSFDVPKTSKDGTTGFTVHTIEFNGSPMRQLLHNWINDNSDIQSGLTHYSGGKSEILGREVTIRDRYEMEHTVSGNSKNFIFDEENNIVWSRVREVECGIRPYEVYNLTVSGNHTFIANNAIVHNCGGTGNMLSMDPDGWLYPCIRYMESSLGTEQPPLRIGHVDIGIGERECDKNCIDCLNAITRRSQSTDECFNCPIAFGCAWCSGYNYQVTGTADKRVTYICIMHKARALANSYFWNTYYRKHGKDERKTVYCPKEWALELIDEAEYDMLVDLSKKEGDE